MPPSHPPDRKDPIGAMLVVLVHFNLGIGGQLDGRNVATTFPSNLHKDYRGNDNFLCPEKEIILTIKLLSQFMHF